MISIIRTTLLFGYIVFSSFTAYCQCNPDQIFDNDSTNAFCFEIQDNIRKCYSNNIPSHEYGPFGGTGVLVAQEFDYSMCLYPELDNTLTYLFEDLESPQCGGGIVFGVSDIGINYSPFARLYFVNPNTLEENTNFHEEAEFILNMDLNGGHVNTLGRYHYHTAPIDYFLNDIQLSETSHSPIVGYAADGFPIYYKYLYTEPNNSESGVSAFNSSYSLREGERNGDGVTAPSGAYDGQYYEDYEYLPSLSELDECGGRFGVTPEYPNGTYYYVLTDNWPYIPRCFKGMYPDNSFKIGPNCPNSSAADDCSETEILGVQSVVDHISLRVFPNPVSSTLRVQLDEKVLEQISNISIYSNSAKLVYNSTLPSNQLSIDHLDPGIYFIQITIGKDQLTKKIIIN